MADAWFSRTVSTSDPILESSYSKLSGTPTCTGTNKICAIKTFDNGSGQPVIDQSTLEDMVHALDSRSNLPNIQLMT